MYSYIYVYLPSSEYVTKPQSNKNRANKSTVHGTNARTIVKVRLSL
jgi:hypothetical protein